MTRDASGPPVTVAPVPGPVQAPAALRSAPSLRALAVRPSGGRPPVWGRRSTAAAGTPRIGAHAVGPGARVHDGLRSVPSPESAAGATELSLTISSKPHVTCSSVAGCPPMSARSRSMAVRAMLMVSGRIDVSDGV